MAKIYLSPAAHLHDNSTKCPTSCGENVHNNLYMDIVERRLKELGFEVKRGDKALTGATAIHTRTAEANAWGADLYYVSHTNAGGGRYSMTMYYPGAANLAKANIVHKYRKCITHKIKSNNSLSEIRRTKMCCLYDELFFHDNAEDCKWFHNGGMEKLAEETCQAFCEMFGITYKVHEEPKKEEPKTEEPKKEEAKTAKFKVGDLVSLTTNAVYTTGKTIPSWVKKKNWYVASVVGERVVLGKSEDGANNINSPVNEIYLVKVVKTSNTTSAVKPSTTTKTEPVAEKVPTITYQAHTGGLFGKWYGKIKGDSDYAGVSGKAITAIKAATDIGTVKVRVHTVNGKYYDWVANNDKKQGGYAGVYGKNIDTVQAHYEGDGYVVEYRVAPVGKNYLSWIRDYNNTNSMGYAGVYGKAIDRIQFRIVKK